VDIKSKHFDMINALPVEISLAILAKCDLKSLATASRVSRSWKRFVCFPFINCIQKVRTHFPFQSSLAEDDSLWKTIYQSMVVSANKNPNFNAKEKEETDSWKEMLKQFYQSAFGSLKYVMPSIIPPKPRPSVAPARVKFLLTVKSLLTPRL